MHIGEVDVTNNGKMIEEVNHRTGEAKKVSEGMQKLYRRYVTREAIMGIHEGIAELSLLHGSEV